MEVEALLEAGADVHATTGAGRYPRGLALQHGHKQLADLLVRRRKLTCAVCRRPRGQQGVVLRACKGCGGVTAVRYCSQACCRTHCWCCQGHGRECEAARRGEVL